MLTEEHDILTNNGEWKNILDLTTNDTVATLQGLSQIIYVPVQELSVIDVNTNVYHAILSNADLRVTHNHSVYADLYSEEENRWLGYAFRKPADLMGKTYVIMHDINYGIVNEEENPGVEKIIQYQGKAIYLRISNSKSQVVLLRRNLKAAWVPICDENDVDNIQTAP